MLDLLSVGGPNDILRTSGLISFGKLKIKARDSSKSDEKLMNATNKKDYSVSFRSNLMCGTSSRH